MFLSPPLFFSCFSMIGFIMIEFFNKKSYTDFVDLLVFIQNNQDYDFYLTQDNTRVFIETQRDLKKFINTTTMILVDKDPYGINGILAICKSVGGDVQRNYVKILSKNAYVAKGLLTILTWNDGREFYSKINKDSRNLKSFYKKGFVFAGNRGKQILLQRAKCIIPPMRTNFKDKDEYTSSRHRY